MRVKPAALTLFVISSILLLVLAIVLLQALGHAGLTRVYLPAITAMTLLFLISSREAWRPGVTEVRGLAGPSRRRQGQWLQRERGLQ